MRTIRQPANTIHGTGVIRDGDHLIGEARYRMQFFSLHRIVQGPHGSMIQQREREVYGDGELLGSGRLTAESSLVLQLRDGRAIRFVAIPHAGGREFDIVPDVGVNAGGEAREASLQHV